MPQRVALGLLEHQRGFQLAELSRDGDQRRVGRGHAMGDVGGRLVTRAAQRRAGVAQHTQALRLLLELPPFAPHQPHAEQQRDDQKQVEQVAPHPPQQQAEKVLHGASCRSRVSHQQQDFLTGHACAGGAGQELGAVMGAVMGYSDGPRVRGRRQCHPGPRPVVWRRRVRGTDALLRTRAGPGPSRFTDGWSAPPWSCWAGLLWLLYPHALAIARATPAQAEHGRRGQLVFESAARPEAVRRADRNGDARAGPVQLQRARRRRITPIPASASPANARVPGSGTVPLRPSSAPGPL